MELHVRIEGRADLSGQIFRELRAAILAGKLRGGDAVPPSRELARQLEVARSTVAIAYDRLVGEGYLTGRVGSGTFVSAGLARPPSAPAPTGALVPRDVWDGIPPASGRHVPAPYDFRVGVPDVYAFPWSVWRRITASQLTAPSVEEAMYSPPPGLPRLQAAIARHVGASRGVSAHPDQVMITNGIRQAIDLTARVLLEPGDTVAVEDPGYLPPRRLFASLGLNVAPVPVDDQGLVVDAIPAAARAVFVTPSHQFPLGIAMSLPRRLSLLDWAVRRRAVVIEDDYDSDFRFSGRPLETLHSLDNSGRVVYVASFSKLLMPTLRLGFLIAPPGIQNALTAARAVTDWHTPAPSQQTLAEFIDSGHLARHLRRMRTRYQVRHDLITATIAHDLGRWLTPLPSHAGMHLTARAAAGVNASTMDAIVADARQRGVKVFPLHWYASRPDECAGLVLGYGAIDVAAIPSGLTKLRATLAATLG
jgi:GntR family transcriptional regulator / MocR family aminotransferase